MGRIYKKNNTYIDIKDHEYDIEENVKKLEEFYINEWERN